LIAPQARQRVPLPENSRLKLTAPSDPKVRFVENRLVFGGLRERLQTAQPRRSDPARRTTALPPRADLAMGTKRRISSATLGAIRTNWTFLGGTMRHRKVRNADEVETLENRGTRRYEIRSGAAPAGPSSSLQNGAMCAK
jgi:hypothetical protein